MQEEAERVGHRLPFREHVDPGEEFWFKKYSGSRDDNEIVEEAKDLSR